MMISGFILRRSETDYVVNCDAQGKGGYNVVPRILDPSNEYSIWDVDAYIVEHPEMLIDMQAIDAEEARKTEIATLKAYLSSTDYIYPKCLELGLDVNVEYTEVVQRRKDARMRIQELETSLTLL